MFREIFFIDLACLNLLAVPNSSHANELTLSIPSIIAIKFAIMLYKNITLLRFFVLDIFWLSMRTNSGLVYLFASPIIDLRINLMCWDYRNTNTFLSFSGIWANISWMERECSELNQVYFQGLRDSRRLLLDYSVNKLSFMPSDGSYTNFNEMFSDCIYGV